MYLKEQLNSFLYEIRSRLLKIVKKSIRRLVIFAIIVAGLWTFIVYQSEPVSIYDYLVYLLNILVFFCLPIFFIASLGLSREYWKHKNMKRVIFQSDSISIGRSSVRVKSFWKTLEKVHIDKPGYGPQMVFTSRHWLSRGQQNSVIYVPIPADKLEDARKLTEYYNQAKG